MDLCDLEANLVYIVSSWVAYIVSNISKKKSRKEDANFVLTLKKYMSYLSHALDFSEIPYRDAQSH